jgi:hypothetical protein
MFTKEQGLNKALIMALMNIQNYFVRECTQVNMMFVMLLWVCIHTGKAEKFAWPRWESNPRPLGY